VLFLQSSKNHIISYSALVYALIAMRKTSAGSPLSTNLANKKSI